VVNISYLIYRKVVFDFRHPGLKSKTTFLKKYLVKENNMSYLNRITNAIIKIRDSDRATRDKYNYSRNHGLSLQMIKKVMGAYQVTWVYINRALREGVEKGTLIKTGGKYKVAVIKKKSRKLRKCKYGRDTATGKCRKKSVKRSRKCKHGRDPSTGKCRKRRSAKRKVSRKRRSAKRKVSRKRRSAKRKVSRKRRSAKRKVKKKLKFKMLKTFTLGAILGGTGIYNYNKQQIAPSYSPTTQSYSPTPSYSPTTQSYSPTPSIFDDDNDYRNKWMWDNIPRGHNNKFVPEFIKGISGCHNPEEHIRNTEERIKKEVGKPGKHRNTKKTLSDIYNARNIAREYHKVHCREGERCPDYTYYTSDYLYKN
jgi:hypothetical protein